MTEVNPILLAAFRDRPVYYRTILGYLVKVMPGGFVVPWNATDSNPGHPGVEGPVGEPANA